jgi:transposase
MSLKMGRQHTFLTLDLEQEAALELIYKSAKSHSERQRHQAVLLNARKKPITEITLLLGVALVSVHRWCKNYKTAGLAGLASKPKLGKTPKLSVTNETHVQIVQKHMAKDGRKVDALQVELSELLGGPISKYTVKRFLKKTIIPTNDTD